jgi:hypothetical protein
LICSKIGKRLLLQWKARKAAQWYGELFAMTSEVEPAYYYRYAQSLRSISENDKANQIMEKFDQISGNDSRVLPKRKYMDAIKAQEDIK